MRRLKPVRRRLLLVSCLWLSCALAAVSLAGAPLRIDADFPSGNIVVDRIDGDEAFVRQDLRDTAGHWFYWHFRVRGGEGRTVRFHFANKNVLGPQGPAYSLDAGATWHWLGSGRSNTDGAPPPEGFLFRFPADAAEVRFCFAIPYAESNLRQFLNRHKDSSALRTGVLCKTPKGRSAEVLYLGRIDGPSEYRLAFTCRHHACESAASFVLEGLMEAILADSQTGRWFCTHVAVAAIPFVDKDGVEAGDQGKNRKPHDHNRDYAGDSIYSTVAAIKKLLPQWSEGRLDVAIDLHCPSVNESIIQFIGGPEEAVWERTLKLSQCLESCQSGPLHHDAKRNMPFGTSWNKGAGLKGATFGGWARRLPNIQIAAALEIPYSQVGTAPVTADGARAVGRDLAEAIKKYLERELIVTVDLPAKATPAQTRKAAEAQTAKAASCGAGGVAVVVRGMNAAAMASIGDIAQGTAKRGMKLWAAVHMPDPSAAELARSLASLPVEGLALLFAPPQGEPIEPSKRETLLAVKRQGDKLGETIRQIKRQLGSRKKLALCVPLSAIAPETARGLYVPVGDLVRDGTLDLVALSDAERANFHRLRLLRDAPLRAGCFLDAKSVEETRRAGQLSRTVLEAVQNDTCQLLWLDGFPIHMVAQVAPAAVAGLRQSQRKRADLEAALAKGELAVDQEISEKNCNDQASLHGVAQSFTPSRDGACPLVQVYAAIRGSTGPLPPALHMEIRSDDHGKPAGAVLAKTDIPAAEFGLEPACRWGSAQFDPPLLVKKGQTYWIYLTNKSHPDGNYVWRMFKDAAGPRGHAWSKRYDYTKHTWVFRVYLNKEPSQ